MSDLIERLRAVSMRYPAVELLREAADRIASLEAALADAREALRDLMDALDKDWPIYADDLSDLPVMAAARAAYRAARAHPSPTTLIETEAADHIANLEAALAPFAEIGKEVAELDEARAKHQLEPVPEILVPAEHIRRAARALDGGEG